VNGELNQARHAGEGRHPVRRTPQDAFQNWIPACAGMTDETKFSEGGTK
jgi:hypothetical protein